MFPHFIDDRVRAFVSYFPWNFGVILKSRLSKLLELHHFQLTIFIPLLPSGLSTCSSFITEDSPYSARYFSSTAVITLGGYLINACLTQAWGPQENKTMLCLLLSSLAWCHSINMCWKHKCNFLWLYPLSSHGPLEVEGSEVDDSGQAFCHVWDSHSRKTA